MPNTISLPQNSIIGTLGPAFTFHDIVRQLEHPENEYRYFDAFNSIFEALNRGEIQIAIVATHNTLHGDIANNKGVIQQNNYRVVNTIDLPVSLHLAARKQKETTHIEQIYAHPVAWAECSIYLSSLNAIHIESSSNAQALLDMLANGGEHCAAISSREAIAHYGLTMLQENIHDPSANITTFSLVVKKG